MDIHNRRGLKTAAGQALAKASYDPGKLVLIYTGATFVLALLLQILAYVLDQQISATGGLSGVDTRAILETVQSVLELAQMIIVPFWNVGWIYTTIRIYREEQVSPASLLQGFRSFGPVLRLYLLQYGLYLGIGLMCSYLASIIFLLTPWSQPLLTAMEQPLAGTELAVLETQLIGMVGAVIWPLLLIVCAVLVVGFAPIAYRLRMAQYYVIDHPEQGAVMAIRQSFRMTKKKVLALLKLDLSFWWFYALEALTCVVLYLDLILPVLGVELPLSAEASYLGTFVLYALCQLGLYRWRKGQVDVTYAAAYDALQAQNQPPQTQMENL